MPLISHARLAIPSLFYLIVTKNGVRTTNSHCHFSLQYNYYFLHLILKLELIIKNTCASFPFSFVITYTNTYISLYMQLFLSLLFALLTYNFFWILAFFRNAEKCYQDWSFYVNLESYFMVKILQLKHELFFNLLECRCTYLQIFPAYSVLHPYKRVFKIFICSFSDFKIRPVVYA